MGLFGGGSKSSKQKTKITNTNETHNLAAQDGQVAGGDLVIYNNLLSDDVVEDAFEFAKDANYVSEQATKQALDSNEYVTNKALGSNELVTNKALSTAGNVVYDALSFGKDSNYNLQEIADQALLFGDESQERMVDLSRLAFDKNFNTVEKVIDGFLGNQKDVQDHAYDVQNYAMQSLASSKGIEAPMVTKNMVIALAVVAGGIILLKTKIFKR